MNENENLEEKSLCYLENLYGKLIELKKMTRIMLDVYLTNTTTSLEIFEIENNYEDVQVLGNAIFEILSFNVKLTKDFIENLYKNEL